MQRWYRFRGPGLVFLALTLALTAALSPAVQAGPAAVPAAVDRIGAPAAWSEAESAAPMAAADPAQSGALTPVVVAVIDTGVDLDDPLLAGRLLAGRNLISGDPDLLDVSDDSPGRHGTRVAELLAAAAGPVPVRILPVKALWPDGTGDLDDVACAIRWAVRWRGAAGERVRVINLSLGRRMPAAPATLSAAAAFAREQGVLLVAAAGNDGQDLDGYYPASLPGVIAVGGVRPDGSPDPNSGQGAPLLAPEAEPGTSFAAPLVAGGAAVLWSAYPDRSRAEVAEALLQAQDGSGVFRMEKALERLGARAAGNPLPAVGPPSDMRSYILAPARVLLAWSAPGPAGAPPPAGYRVWSEESGLDRRGVSGTALRVTHLIPGRTYTFHVAALDWAGRLAGPDAAITVTMPNLPRGVQ